MADYTVSKRQTEYRRRMKEQGLTLVREWVPIEAEKEFRQVAQMMRHSTQSSDPSPEDRDRD
jgi:DNA-binding LacI/PurR family transcriptional regulator